MEDALKDILSTVALRAALYFRTDFRPPFGVMVPPYQRVARFHLLVKGRCRVRLASGTEVQLAVGDLVLVPNGSAHLIQSGPEAPELLLDDAFAVAGFTGQGPFVLGDGDPAEACQMICGHFEFARGADHPLFRALPEIIHVPRGARAIRPLFDDLVSLLETRIFAEEQLAAASVGRLSEAIFIEAIHASIEQSPPVGQILSAMSDPRIGRALSLIHDDIAADWTIDRLAREAALSRTQFAGRFTRSVGMAPMAYVAEWRMQRALYLVTQTRTPLKTVSALIGYGSAAAFTRAFTRRFGQNPDHTRRSENENIRAN